MEIAAPVRKPKRRPPSWEEIELMATILLICLGIWFVCFAIGETVKMASFAFSIIRA